MKWTVKNGLFFKGLLYYLSIIFIDHGQVFAVIFSFPRHFTAMYVVDKSANITTRKALFTFNVRPESKYL